MLLALALLSGCRTNTGSYMEGAFLSYAPRDSFLEIAGKSVANVGIGAFYVSTIAFYLLLSAAAQGGVRVK